MTTSVKYIALFLVFTALATPKAGTCQGINSCLSVAAIDSFANQNPDSVALDTCLNSPTFNQRYARQWWQFEFTVNAISLPAFPADTLSWDSLRSVSHLDFDTTWEAIDTAYMLLRTEFQSLERTYGHITLRKLLPWITDTTYGQTRAFILRFDNYCPILGATASLDSIQQVTHVVYNHRDLRDSNIPNERSSQDIRSQYLILFPNPTENYLNIVFNRGNFIAHQTDVNIYDMLGQLRIVKTIQAGQNLQAAIDVSGLTNGMYILHCGATNKCFAVVK